MTRFISPEDIRIYQSPLISRIFSETCLMPDFSLISFLMFTILDILDSLKFFFNPEIFFYSFFPNLNFFFHFPFLRFFFMLYWRMSSHVSPSLHFVFLFYILKYSLDFISQACFEVFISLIFLITENFLFSLFLFNYILFLFMNAVYSGVWLYK